MIEVYVVHTMSIQREQILKCACDLYLSEGFEGLSMRKLAGCVGCTAPALYRYYENKEEVMQDVVGEAYRHFAQFLYRALEGRNPAERFRLAGQSYLDFALEQPGLYEVLYVPPDLLGIQPGSSDEASDHASSVGQFWSDRVREMMDAGLFHEADIDEVSLTLWAHAHGMVSLYHRGLLEVGTDEEFRGLLTASFKQLLKGIGTEQYRELVESRDAPENQRWVDGTAGTADR
jgi:AcrR family transcriptional regulator